MRRGQLTSVTMIGSGTVPVRCLTPPMTLGAICRCLAYILVPMAKHLIDLDEQALSAARAELGTPTIKETVNEALRRTTQGRGRKVAAALDVLARVHLEDRGEAWR